MSRIVDTALLLMSALICGIGALIAWADERPGSTGRQK